jgi:hypothetical protein
VGGPESPAAVEDRHDWPEHTIAAGQTWWQEADNQDRVKLGEP